MRKLRHALACLGLSLVFSSAAFSGPVDSPLPAFGSGDKAFNLFFVPGVMSSADLVTVFSCTNLEKRNTIQIGVETFLPGGGDAEAFVQKTVVLGGTGIIATKAVSVYGGEFTLNLTNTNQVRSARILATSKQIACAASVVGAPTEIPPTVAWDLPVIRKKQLGD